MHCTATVLLLAASATPALAQVLAAEITLPLDATAGQFAPNPLLHGDLDGDGAPDLVGVDAAGYRVLLGDGAGRFTELPRVAVGTLNTDAVLTDFDGDGRLDLFLRDFLTGQLLLGDGAGGFQAAAALPTAPNAADVLVADCNRDAIPDLIQALGTDVTVFLGLGGGAYAPPRVSPAGALAADLVLGDVTGDGIEDLVAGGLFVGGPVLRGDGNGGFLAIGTLPEWARFPRLLDVDRDGSQDLVYTSLLGGGIWWLRNDGAGSFGPATQIEPTGSLAASGDLDGDGITDLLVLGGPQVTVRRGVAAGGFAPAETLPASPASAWVLVDYDLDGRTDLVTSHLSGPALGLFANAAGAQAGLATFGTGTPSCRGRIGINGNRVPADGAVDFRVVCSNAPPRQLGLVVFGAQDPVGSDPLGLGLLLHIDVIAGSVTDVLVSGPAGAASYPLPIPGGLVGSSVSTQTIWRALAGLGDSCSPAAEELVSSRGLRITVQP